jgi:Na+/proline symporter
MRKLTLKWKLFLIINYFQLVVILFCVLGAIASLIGPKNKLQDVVLMIGIILIFLLVALSCMLNIFIVNRFFPDKPLNHKTRRLLKISRIALIVFTAFAALITLAGTVAFATESAKQNDFDVVAIIFFGIVFIFCLYITILQFQIPKYLDQQNTGSINQLIDSIGK